MHVRRAVFACIVALSLTACATQEEALDTHGTWVGTITTEGNVTTVVNDSGSVWGGTARLVEEVSIGVESGADPYMFGRVGGVVASDERIYVLDRQVPILRMYDHDGRHQGDVGRVGSGPGEYQRPDAIGIADDGRVFVRDPGQGRVLVYSPEGTVLESWTPQLSVRTYLAPAVTGEGRYFEPVVIERSAELTDLKWGMQQFGGDGAVGSPIPVPDLPFEETGLEVRSGGLVRMRMSIPFYPRLHWVLAPTGAMVAGSSDDYRYEVHYPDGRVTVVSRPWNPVPVPEGAVRAEERRVLDAIRESVPEWRWEGPPIPDTMPAFSLLVPDRDGRIWVQRVVGTRRDSNCDPEERGRECWPEIGVLEVFGPDGRYMGVVEAPSSFPLGSRRFISGATLVAATTDEAGTIMVKRFRLMLPGDG